MPMGLAMRGRIVLCRQSVALTSVLLSRSHRGASGCYKRGRNHVRKRAAVQEGLLAMQARESLMRKEQECQQLSDLLLRGAPTAAQPAQPPPLPPPQAKPSGSDAMRSWLKKSFGPGPTPIAAHT